MRKMQNGVAEVEAAMQMNNANSVYISTKNDTNNLPKDNGVTFADNIGKQSKMCNNTLTQKVEIQKKHMIIHSSATFNFHCSAFYAL
jgi:hypothetical protein